MEPWERIERKIDRLTWLFVALAVLQVGLHFVSLWRTLFWSIIFLVIVDVVLLTPFMRALFPRVGRYVVAANRWIFRKMMGVAPQ